MNNGAYRTNRLFPTLANRVFETQDEVVAEMKIYLEAHGLPADKFMLLVDQLRCGDQENCAAFDDEDNEKSLRDLLESAKNMENIIESLEEGAAWLKKENAPFLPPDELNDPDRVDPAWNSDQGDGEDPPLYGELP